MRADRVRKGDAEGSEVELGCDPQAGGGPAHSGAQQHAGPDPEPPGPLQEIRTVNSQANQI